MRHPKPGEWTSEQYSRGKVASYKPFNFVDGEGVRNSLYVSGCLFACAGCYNKVAQSFSYGERYTPELEKRIHEVHQSLRDGECVECSSKDELETLLESL